MSWCKGHSFKMSSEREEKEEGSQNIWWFSGCKSNKHYLFLFIFKKFLQFLGLTCYTACLKLTWFLVFYKNSYVFKLLDIFIIFRNIRNIPQFNRITLQNLSLFIFLINACFIRMFPLEILLLLMCKQISFFY